VCFDMPRGVQTAKQQFSTSNMALRGSGVTQHTRHQLVALTHSRETAQGLNANRYYGYDSFGRGHPHAFTDGMEGW
jgi:hypothetical protein